MKRISYSQAADPARTLIAEAIKAKFPNAKVDHSTDQVFQLTLVKTPKRPNGGQITFGVSTQTKRTTVIGVPFIAFCE